ncbi:MAG TPA: hypothetical protein VKR06_34175 [Ktedonosporobacter sp.]|nr:hypothetical protein [Ktedonosporobacter sp.]
MQFATWLDRYYFEKYILDVSIATLERGGVTSKVDTYQFLLPIDAWGLPKYPGRTMIVAQDANIAEELAQFIRDNEPFLREPDTWLGTWVNPRTRLCHLDITVLSPSLEDARREALRLGQKERRTILALYNFKHNQTVYLEHEAAPINTGY